jgi:hypothetical protein
MKSAFTWGFFGQVEVRNPMPRPRRKTPVELMQEAFWARRDMCRIFHKDPRTIDRFINNLDPRKRLKGYMINGEFMAEKKAVLACFQYQPFVYD